MVTSIPETSFLTIPNEIISLMHLLLALSIKKGLVSPSPIYCEHYVSGLWTGSTE